MLAVEAMADSLPASPPAGLFVEMRICAVTGRVTADAVPAKDVFSATFGDFDILAAPSGWVDRRVAEVLDNGHLRWSSWVWSETRGWMTVSRGDIARIVVEKQPPRPWAAYAAEDMRRHGGLLTHINTEPGHATIQFGRRVADLSETAEVVERARAMLALGFRRRDLDGELNAGRLAKLDMRAWMEWVEWARPRRGSGSFALGLFCAGAMAKEERDARAPDDPS